MENLALFSGYLAQIKLHLTSRQ